MESMLLLRGYNNLVMLQMMKIKAEAIPYLEENK